MTYQPVVPFSGAAGWEFLTRTRARQQQAFDQSAVNLRDTDAFRARIASVKSAADLVNDRQLLKVALGAFGLDEDINNSHLIERVLSSNTYDSKALTSRFADKRYQSLSRAFGFGDAGGPRVAASGFADRIVASYRTRAFEVAVGNQNETMRLALGLERDLGEIASKDVSDDGRWYSVMANKPLRAVFETALGLPTSFGALDLDRQLSEFRSRAERVFGTSDIADLAAPERQDDLRRIYLARAQIAEGTGGIASSASIALTLLQGMSPPG